MTETSHKEVEPGSLSEHMELLVTEAIRRAPLDAARYLMDESDANVATVLQHVQPAPAYRILMRFPKERRQTIVNLTSGHLEESWGEAQKYSEDSVGRMMEPVIAVVSPQTTVSEVVDKIRDWAHDSLITYGWVVDENRKLLGVLTMRDLLLAGRDEPMSEIMLPEPFFLRPDMAVSDAMKEVVHRHYPVYPVCDDSGKLLGIVQGYSLFEHQKFEIMAQAGRMVGVTKEEHATTTWQQSLKMRHPWLQLNLLTAFTAAFVVSLFEDTIAQVVVLAAFLPVLAGQSGNTGCQSLAVTIRGLTLDEFEPGVFRTVLIKETLLGLINGAIVGLVAGAAMVGYASITGAENGLVLGLVVFLAMTGACLASGVTGVMVPLGLKRAGADPATASSIFLTTATDVVSMGLFLWLANVLVL